MRYFVSMLQALKNAFGNSFTVSTAIPTFNKGLNFPYEQIFATCDYVNLMSYDLLGGQHETRHHAPLLRAPGDSFPYNISESVKFLLDRNVDRRKIIVGLPAYGRHFRLTTSNNGVGAPTDGTSGHTTYKDICARIRSNELREKWDSNQKVPYAFSGNFWVGYDNEKSVTEKANYINKLDLGGMMFSLSIIYLIINKNYFIQIIFNKDFIFLYFFGRVCEIATESISQNMKIVTKIVIIKHFML